MALSALLWSALSGCGEQPSKVSGAPSVPPNESYRLENGEEEGFLWRCIEGQRVRMYRSLAGKRPGKWVITRGACGQPMVDEPSPYARRPMSGAGWW